MSQRPAREKWGLGAPVASWPAFLPLLRSLHPGMALGFPPGGLSSKLSNSAACNTTCLLGCPTAGPHFNCTRNFRLGVIILESGKLALGC